MRVELIPNESPATWVSALLPGMRDASVPFAGGRLVGAVLERRFGGISKLEDLAHTAHDQSARVGDFAVSTVIYHVTAAPSLGVMEKCSRNLKGGFRPVLLVPAEQESRARALAQEAGIEKDLMLVSIEDFVALNVIELATDEKKDFLGVLREIVDLYNERLREVETDLSLQIVIK